MYIIKICGLTSIIYKVISLSKQYKVISLSKQ